MCKQNCKKESRENKSFKRREIFKVMAAVEKKISKEKSFTSLDIVGKLSDKGYKIKAHKVANILSMLISEEEYPELQTSKINVVRSDYVVVKATLYHLDGSDPLDYMNICQIKKPTSNEVDFEVDFSQNLDSDFEDEFSEELNKKSKY